MESTLVFLLNEEQLNELVKKYGQYSVDLSNDYVIFEAQIPGCHISVYSKVDKEGQRKAVFQGANASQISSCFAENQVKQKAKVKIAKKTPYKFADQIGSDEVGTGDLFGPIVVCAAFVDRDGLSKIEEYGVTDSKKLSDDFIFKLGPRLVKEFDYSLLILDNEKFNDLYDSGINMNEMKAKMHNQALFNLEKRHKNALIFQDQFAEEPLYYRYLRNEKNIVKGITFATKGELKFPSVALASVIARYAFLLKMQKLSEEIGQNIPFGAGKSVDEFVLSLKKKKPDLVWRKYIKANFGNCERLKLF